MDLSYFKEVEHKVSHLFNSFQINYSVCICSSWTIHSVEPFYIFQCVYFLVQNSEENWVSFESDMYFSHVAGPFMNFWSLNILIFSGLNYFKLPKAMINGQCEPMRLIGIKFSHFLLKFTFFLKFSSEKSLYPKKIRYISHVLKIHCTKFYTKGINGRRS